MMKVLSLLGLMSLILSEIIEESTHCLSFNAQDQCVRCETNYDLQPETGNCIFND